MKKIVILVVLCFLTGCTVNYNIEFLDDLTVQEKAIIGGNEELFVAKYKTTHENVLIEALSPYENDLKENGYQYHVNLDGSETVIIEKEYADIESYLKSSLLFNDYFDKINYSKDGDIIRIETEGFNSNNIEDPNRFYVKNLDIAIKSAYKITNSNASRIDEKTNTYHFMMNEQDEDFQIILEINTSSKFIANLDIYVIMIVFVGIVIASWIFVFVNKKRNG